MSPPVISFTNVSKIYRRGAERMNLRAALPGSPGRRVRSNGYPALQDIDFEVMKQELVGVVGPNGAGKSTLLKLIASVIAPTSGRVQVRGRVASLIELGVGFHPDLSGRDNVRFSAAILGMGRKEIARRFDEIVAFSGIETFIDTPVKRYSSGMLARLGFAVASHLDAEVVLVDEVLAVGDAEFQRRGYDRMQQLRREGATLLFVTHNMYLIGELCQRAIRLERGRIVDEGPARRVVDGYQAAMEPPVLEEVQASSEHAVAVTDLSVSPPGVEVGGAIDISVRLHVSRPVEARLMGFFTTPAGFNVAGGDIPGSDELFTSSGTWTVSGQVQVPLVAGNYRLIIGACEEAAGGALVPLAVTSAELLVEAPAGSPRQYALTHYEGDWVFQRTDAPESSTVNRRPGAVRGPAS